MSCEVERQGRAGLAAIQPIDGVGLTLAGLYLGQLPCSCLIASHTACSYTAYARLERQQI